MFKGLDVKVDNLIEDLSRDFENSVSLLKNGQFSSCLGVIESMQNKMKNADQAYNVIFDWLLQINRYVCRKLTKSQRRTADDHILANEAEAILHNVQGLPPTSKRLEIEFIVIYNHSVDVVRNRYNSSYDTELSLSYIQKGLMRLSSLVEDQSSASLFPPDALVPIVQLILRYKEEVSSLLLKELFLICCIASWLLFCNKRNEEALRLMTLVESAAHFSYDEQTGEGCIIEPLNCNALSSLKLHDFFNLTIAYCSLLCGNVAGASGYLKVVTDEEWKPQIQYVLACLLLSSNRTDEALSFAKSFVTDGSNSLTSKWKSRYFNLSGCCLARQGKNHSAVECFRKSLIGDPTRLLPLWNICLQYRSLKLTDAELSGLRLLLQEVQEQDENEIKLNESVDPLPLIASLTITKADVLYILAKRHHELSSITLSVDFYKQLLDNLKTEPHYDSLFLPSLSQIYQEAIFATYRASRFTECIKLCEEVIANCPETVRDIEPGMLRKLLLEACDSRVIGSNWDLHLEPIYEAPTYEQWKKCGTEPRAVGCVILMLKSLALSKMGTVNEGIAILKRVRLALSIMSIDDDMAESLKKRRRLQEGSTVCVTDREFEEWKVISSNVHCCLGVLLSQVNNVQDAAYLLRSAILIWPDNLEAYFHYVQLHNKDDNESVKKTWAEIRLRLIEPLFNDTSCRAFYTVTKEQVKELDQKFSHLCFGK